MARTLSDNPEEKKPIKKKSFSLSDFKEKFKINDEEQKPLQWLPLSKGYQEITGLEGIPLCELLEVIPIQVSLLLFMKQQYQHNRMVSYL